MQIRAVLRWRPAKWNLFRFALSLHLPRFPVPMVVLYAAQKAVWISALRGYHAVSMRAEGTRSCAMELSLHVQMYSFSTCFR